MLNLSTKKNSYFLHEKNVEVVCFLFNIKVLGKGMNLTILSLSLSNYG